MRYIAFEATYNEQIWDSDTMLVTWTKHPGLIIKEVRPVLTRKTWRRLPNTPSQDALPGRAAAAVKALFGGR